MRRPFALAIVAALASACTDPAPAPTLDAAPDVAADATPDLPRDTASEATTPMTRDIALTPPPTSLVVEPGVRRDVMLVDVPAAPANPTTRAETPAALNRVQVLRYRVDSATPTPAQAVIVAVPGFLGGGGSFDPLARALVKRGAMAGTPVEVWALDRRSNLLEDLRGMHAASALRDPEVATGYYLRRDVTIGGERFEAYRGAAEPELSYMAEWGLATLVRDLRAVIARVPMSRQHVVLLGHSLGASVIEAYAAWDFDGAAGFRDIAGLAMLDGVAGGASVSEAEYRAGGNSSVGGFMSPGVERLRASGPWFVALPFLGVRALVVSEIVARRAALTPDAVVVDAERDALYRILLGVPQVPPMSNAAAMGFAFDESSCPLAFARMSVGAPTGGPVHRIANPFATGEMLTVPDSATDTYRWNDAAAVTPREFTPLAQATAAWATTPSNFSEWYFPTRLSIDVTALGNLSLAADAWQVREGLRVTHGREVDVPVLGIAAGLVVRATAYDRLRDRIASTVGADLPAAGATRTMNTAFRAMAAARMTHIDPITGADGNAENPVPEAVFTFATGATRGAVTPAM